MRLLFFLLILAPPTAVLAGPKRASPPAPADERVVAEAGTGETCSKTLESCLKRCKGEDKQGCQMECETDCSVCSFEATGSVSAVRCTR